MASYNEIDPLLALEISGVKSYGSQAEAWAARIYEWLNTVQGEVYGDPAWGNILPQFKHEPTNTDRVQIAMEARLLAKLAKDLPDVPVHALSVKEGNEIDKVRITIQIQGTVITQDVTI